VAGWVRGSLGRVYKTDWPAATRRDGATLDRLITYSVAGIRGCGESTGALNPRRAPIECPGLAGTARGLVNTTAAPPSGPNRRHCRKRTGERHEESFRERPGAQGGR